MSDTLNRMEKPAFEDNITDQDRIGSILNSFLEMKSSRLMGPKSKPNPYYGYLTKDIAQGFVLDSEKLKECSIGEILTLIGCEPGVPWYEINEEEEIWLAEEKLTKEFCSADHSFAFARALLRAKTHEPVISRFLKINYREFIQNLANRINASDDKTDQKYSRLCCKKGMRLNRGYYLTQKFIHDYSKMYENMDLDKSMTVGDVITIACQKGSCAWVCGREPLGIYVESIVRSYEVMNYMFMNAIREIAISVGREKIKDLLERCSENGNYDYFSEIEVNEGFKSLILPKDSLDYVYSKYDKSDVELMEKMAKFILS